MQTPLTLLLLNPNIPISFSVTAEFWPLVYERKERRRCLSFLQVFEDSNSFTNKIEVSYDGHNKLLFHLYGFEFVGGIVTGSEIVNLSSIVENLSKRLETVENKIDERTTRPHQKNEVVFRGEPEIGFVTASGVYNAKGDETRYVVVLCARQELFHVLGRWKIFWWWLYKSRVS